MKIKITALLLALSIPSAVQAVESTVYTPKQSEIAKELGPRIAQSGAFSIILECLPQEDAIKLQALDKRTYDTKIPSHINTCYPVTKEYTVQGPSESADLESEADYTGPTEDEAKAQEALNILINPKPVYLSITSVNPFPLTAPISMLLEKNPQLRGLSMDNQVLYGPKFNPCTVDVQECLALQSLEKLVLTNVSYQNNIQQNEHGFPQNPDILTLNIGNAPQLKELVFAEKSDQEQTMQVSVTGNCPRLKSIELNTQWAKDNLRGKIQEERRQTVTKEEGIVSKRCIITIPEQN